jgi:hypothetical protein
MHFYGEMQTLTDRGHSYESKMWEFSLIKLDAEMPTDCKQGNRAAVETKQENILRDDAIVRSYGNKNHKLTQMMSVHENTYILSR